MEFPLPDVLKNAPGMRAAELVVDGLSAFCFNQISSEKFWEVAFPRQAQHELTITIQKLDRDRKPVGNPKTHWVDERVERFFISLENGSLEHYKKFPHGGPRADTFDRKAKGNDQHDLRWMVDLAGTEIGHGTFQRLKPRHASRPRSIASIRHSLFCNLEPENEAVRISPLRSNAPDASDSVELGPTNTFMIGVLLGNSPGEIRFKFEPDLNTIRPLDYNENTRYRIEIINNDTRPGHQHDKFIRGDLRFFYDELIDVSGELKDLWAIPEPRVSPDGDCHPTIFGRETFGP